VGYIQGLSKPFQGSDKAKLALARSQGEKTSPVNVPSQFFGPPLPTYAVGHWDSRITPSYLQVIVPLSVLSYFISSEKATLRGRISMGVHLMGMCLMDLYLIPCAAHIY